MAVPPKAVDYTGLQPRYTGIVTPDEPTRLWTYRRDDHEVTCQVRLAPYGIDIDIVRDGKVVLTRTFETDVEALAWAETKRSARESEGWHPVPTDPGRGQRPVA
jgi:hypothetical protein